MPARRTRAGPRPPVPVTGPGAKAGNSIGPVLVGGMGSGTVFTLFIVPSLYVLIARTHNEGRPAEAARTAPTESRDEDLVPDFAEA